MQDEGSNLSDSDNESQESLKDPFNREVPALDVKEYFARKTKEKALNPSFHSPELMRRFKRFRQSSKQDAPTKIVLKKDRVKKSWWSSRLRLTRNPEFSSSFLILYL